MAAIPNPYAELFREPALLVPGKKPIGRVKLDWTHPLSNGMTRFVLFGKRFSFVDPAVNLSGVVFDYVPNKIIGQYSDFSGELPSWQTDYIDSPEATSVLFLDTELVSTKAAYTVMARCRSHANTASANMFSCDSSSSNLRTWQLRYNTAANPSDLRFVAFRTNSTTTSITSGTVLYEDEWYTVAGAFDASFARLYIDGLEAASPVSNATSQVNIAAGASGVLARLTTSAPTAPGNVFDGDVSWVASWDRVLSDVEFKSMHDDPYQVLIPA
jgi:hypothetical protein